jgi:hypothetical protein
MVPLQDIFSVKGEKIATGEQVISLTLAAPDSPGNHESMDLLFTQNPGERRKPESNEWLKRLMENIVAVRQNRDIPDAHPSEQDAGIRPAIRRWIAPEILHPHKVTIQQSTPDIIPPSPSKKTVQPVSTDEGILKPDLSSDEPEVLEIHVDDRETDLFQKNDNAGESVSTGKETEILSEERRSTRPQVSREFFPKDPQGIDTISPEKENPEPSALSSSNVLFVKSETEETEPDTSNPQVIDTSISPGAGEHEPESAIPCSPEIPIIINWPVVAPHVEEKSPGIIVPSDSREKALPDIPGPSGSDNRIPQTIDASFVSGEVLRASTRENGLVPEEFSDMDLPGKSGDDKPGAQDNDTLGVPGSRDLPESIRDIEDYTKTPDVLGGPDVSMIPMKNSGEGKSSDIPEQISPIPEVALPIQGVPETSLPESIHPEHDDRKIVEGMNQSAPQTPVAEVGSRNKTEEHKDSAADNSPDKKRRDSRRSIVAGIIVVCIVLVIFAGAAIFLSHNLTEGTTHQVTPATLTPVINLTPTHPEVVIPVTGVWVRVQYDRHYYGWIGNPGDLYEVSDTGDTFYSIKNPDKLIQISIQKQDNSGDNLTVMIYHDGNVIYQETTRVPRGEVSNLIDPMTGSAPGAITRGTREL